MNHYDSYNGIVLVYIVKFNQLFSYIYDDDDNQPLESMKVQMRGDGLVMQVDYSSVVAVASDSWNSFLASATGFPPLLFTLCISISKTNGLYPGIFGGLPRSP